MPRIIEKPRIKPKCLQKEPQKLKHTETNKLELS